MPKEKVASQSVISVIGANEHNLKDVSIDIPKHSLVVFTGVSGSGKSSLAFDTIFNEGQRRYMESFSAYARQFLGDMERPKVEKITGLSPVISIEQKTTNKNPRSTVGTITEIYDFMRLLYARIGEAYSYNTGKKMVKFSEEEILQNVFDKYKNEKISILAPIIRGRKGHYRELFEDILKKGFVKVRVDGEVKDITPKMQVDRYKIHDIEVVIDRLQINDDMRERLSQSIHTAIQMGKGLIFFLLQKDNSIVQYSKLLVCADTGISYEEPSPNSFSFNSPYGACPKCKGLGQVYSISLDAIFPDKNLSIEKGGFAPVGIKREASIYKLIAKIARKNKIDVKVPVGELTESQRNILLFNSAQASIPLTIDPEEYGDSPVYTEDFEGIIPMLKRWFSSSNASDFMRDWVEEFLALTPCPSCEGQRLKKESLWFKIDNKNIAQLTQMSLDDLMQWFANIESRLSKKQNLIAKDILKEIRDRLQFLLDVGLNYLTLDRQSKTLSGGESQRIRLATQIGSQLKGITYVLDEPSIGLHQRDNMRLIHSLQKLRDIGNNILVVEHDKDIMLESDYLVDIGPGAGELGGEVVAAGTPKQVEKNKNSLTAQFLNGKNAIKIPNTRRKGNGNFIAIKGAEGNNLQKVNVKFPLGTFICVTGVSGSGKSTLINETLYPILSQFCYHSKTKPLSYQTVSGLENIDKVIAIDQSPIGRTPRSNPATYCGFFTDIRQLFAELPEAKIRGYKPGRFSFNVKGGRCEECEGAGVRMIEMNFLPNVTVPCERCNGKRYNRETLEIRYKGKSISDVLDMTVTEALEFFTAIPSLHRKIKVLQDVGLGYITLGQSAITLSGGEAQRVKLSTELGKRETGKTFYILDEPTTGLHFKDIKLLLDVVNQLVEKGNTVLIIEHNMDVIKSADYLIDLGPEGGNAGGKILFEGTPEAMIKKQNSPTATFLKLEM